MILGTFNQTRDGGYQGFISTLTLDIQSAEFQPNTSDNPKAPAFRIVAGHAELGAAWRHAKDERDYLFVKLDDPSFRSEIKAILVESDDGFDLVWSREREQPKVRKTRRARKTEG